MTNYSMDAGSNSSLISVEQSIISMIGDITGYDVSQLTLETKFRNNLNDLNLHNSMLLEVGSLELAELLIAIDEKFGVNIPDSEVNQMDTIKQLVKYIIERSE